METVITVDQKGFIRKLLEKVNLNKEDIVAVALTLPYLPKEKKIILFNRGAQAEDMRQRWALHSGKVISNDLTKKDLTGKKLSINTYKNTAIREFREELNIEISPENLKKILQFYMEETNKKLFFTLFALKCTMDDVIKLSPDNAEIDKIKLFSLEEFEANQELGDAIKYKKDFIVDYLINEFENDN